MSKVKVNCDNANCKKEFLKSKGEFNRSEKIGRKHYCCRSCYGYSDDNVGFDNVSEDVVKRNQDNIKNYAGNQRDDQSPFRYFMKVSKNNRKKEVNIDLKYLSDLWKSQNGVCSITGFELKLPSGSAGWEDGSRIHRASLDRINPKEGYIKGNVRFISFTANIAMARITDKELIEFCRAVTEYHS